MLDPIMGAFKVGNVEGPASNWLPMYQKMSVLTTSVRYR
jgi:hypothetical protein